MNSAGRFRGELADPAFGRVEPQLQRVEGQAVADRDDQLAVERGSASAFSGRASRPLRGNSGRAACPTWRSAATSSPSRRARQRKPSHLGSYCQPSPVGQLGGEQGFHRRGHRIAGHVGSMAATARAFRTQKKAAPKGGFWLVAGAGFEPATFRL